MKKSNKLTSILFGTALIGLTSISTLDKAYASEKNYYDSFTSLKDLADKISRINASSYSYPGRIEHVDIDGDGDEDIIYSLRVNKRLGGTKVYIFENKIPKPTK